MSPRLLPLVLLLTGSAPLPGQYWDAIHQEMRDALAEISREYFVEGTAASGRPTPVITPALKTGHPWMVVVGFTGGVEKKESKASGVVAIKGNLESHIEEESGVLALTYNNFRWRRAAGRVLDLVGAARAEGGPLPGIRQPMIVVYGHSWGAGSIGKFARQLRTEGMEVSLAIYIDAFSWRNPRVPDNVRYAVNFYQRSGILQGLPMRGKRKLIPENPEATRVLGSYEIDPETEHWGWSWNVLQPLLYRHHHRIAHDVRLQKYLLEILNVKLDLLSRTQHALTSGDSLFERVVILGASLSAGEKAPSPGWLLARRMGTPEDGIFVFARGGAESDHHLGFLDNIRALRPTLIVALDLFYHDFKFSLFLSEGKKAYLREYIKRLHDTGAVVVLGNIPPQVLLRHEHVNRHLASLAPEFPRLVLMDVQGLIGRLDAAGIPAVVNGETVVVRREDVFADRVHLNEFGSALMADLILDRLRAEFPERFPRESGDSNPAPLAISPAP